MSTTAVTMTFARPIYVHTTQQLYMNSCLAWARLSPTFPSSAFLRSKRKQKFLDVQGPFLLPFWYEVCIVVGNIWRREEDKKSCSLLRNMYGMGSRHRRLKQKTRSSQLLQACTELDLRSRVLTRDHPWNPSDPL